MEALLNKPKYDPVTLIIDGNHALCRSIYQPSYRELSTSRGMPTGGIYGFCSILKGLANKLGASSVVVVFDGGHSKRRIDIYGDYKKREPDEEVHEDTGMTTAQYFQHQFSWIKTLLDKLGILTLSVQGREGDDLIFQVAHLLRGKKIIVSEDRDFCSLVTEDTSLYRPVKGEMITDSNFKEATGCETPKHFLYQKVMLGDGSDNIPSVCKGIGPAAVDSILKDISESELSPERIIEVAKTKKGVKYDRLVMGGTAPIERNLGLIDISREEFSNLELMDICDSLKKERVQDLPNATKLMNALEFSHDTQYALREFSAQVYGFDTGSLVDTSYIRERMSGHSTSLYQEVSL